MSGPLITSRAGGSSSRSDYPLTNGNLNRKTALKTRFFSNDHFSSSFFNNEDPLLKRTRVTVKILEGKDLLVSDLPSGTSDPIASVWIGSQEEKDIDLQKEHRVQNTEVRKHTVDPVWDADFIFPLDVQSVEDIIVGRVNVVVRDFDDANGNVHYLDLGRVSVSLEKVVTEGNIMGHAQLVQLPARWYILQRCRYMKKVTGALKIALGLFIGQEVMLSSVENDEEYSSDNQPRRLGKLLQRVRAERGIGGAQALLSSPSHRNRGETRVLTARGGTTALRPKSAPAATTLSSPTRSPQRPFELKPLKAKYPRRETHLQQTDDAPIAQEVTAPADDVSEDEATAKGTCAYEDEERSRRGQQLESPERFHHPSSPTPQVDSSHTTMAQPPRYEQQESPELCPDSPPKRWEVRDPEPAPIKASAKLSRLLAKATNSHGHNALPYLEGATQRESVKTRAQTWQRMLLISMQRLEERSTESAAYGELRALAREASGNQAAQIVTAVRRTGKSCSLSARRRTLRLLASLCWDQPRATSKIYGGIIDYVVERVRDDETASLRGDLAACVGAVMLSALRNGTAEEHMRQTQRFLDLVGGSRMTIRESAGACCAAAVRPPPVPVAVELDTDVHGIDDVRLVFGKMAARTGIMSTVSKESVLLPGGRTLIELPDTLAAASFHRYTSSVALELPSTWHLHPFPEDFCRDIKRLEISHTSRLKINSEKILASLLEAFETPRSQATRAPLLDAVIGMTDICAKYEDESTVINALEGSIKCGRLSETLQKGLPAIARAVLNILNCPVRKAYTWKERTAALQLIHALAILPRLHGAEGPVGEHRPRLIQGALQGKRDSVAVVREAATHALAALGASKAEESRSGRSKSRPGDSGSISTRSATMVPRDADVSHLAAQETALEGARKEIDLRTLVNKVKREAKKERGGGERDEASRARELRAPGWSPKEKAVLNSDLALSRSRLGGHTQPTKNSPKPKRESAGSENNVGGVTMFPHCEVDDVSRSMECSNSVDEVLESTAAPSGARHKERIGATVGTIVPHDRWHRPISGSGAGGRDDEQRGMCDDGVSPSSYGNLGHGPSKIPDLEPQLSLLSKPKDDEKPSKVSSETSQGIAAPSTTAAGAPCTALQPHKEDVDTAQLLRSLNHKSDNISTLLRAMHQRILDIEKYLEGRQERNDAQELSHSAPERKLKRTRSVREEGTVPGPGTRRVPYGDARAATGRLLSLRRKIEHLVSEGDIEGAFRLALASGAERDILRVMSSTGHPRVFRRCLRIETRNRLFGFIARVISAGQYTDHALPWVFEIVQAGDARSLPTAVRMQLAGALYGLASSPNEQGLIAARLGPHLSPAATGSTPTVNPSGGYGVSLEG